ncbi:unnamed protein product [Brassica oleracea]|uniref:(rape) hypothetical protein n=1 Tax=Brassica napus TaxID=3708 RepID=A0A816MWV5_BRANA|nr:unnamed protein product [Brassica napus]
MTKTDEDFSSRSKKKRHAEPKRKKKHKGKQQTGPTVAVKAHSVGRRHCSRCVTTIDKSVVDRKVSPESASQFGELVADPVTNELLHYTEKPETFVSDRINCCVYVFTPDIFTAIRLRDVSSQRKDTAILRRVSSFEALQLATRLVCLSLVCVSLHT